VHLKCRQYVLLAEIFLAATASGVSF